MQKKIAIAVDQSLQSAQAVRYAARMAAAIPELHCVLMHIQPAISQYLLDEAQKSHQARRELDGTLRKNRATAEILLEKCRQQLQQSGVPAEYITTRTQPRHAGVADDILTLSQTLSYDAILVGRRGVSGLQKLIMGSVTARLIDNSQLLPIWMVDGEPTSSKILLAADGSAGALRALDHLGFMRSGAKDGSIHIIHVQPARQDFCKIEPPADPASPGQAVLSNSDGRCMADFHAQACTVLKQYGIAADRVDLQTIQKRSDVARGILEAVRQGDFGTVVIGRRGAGKGRFFGSVSRQVLQKAGNQAVWLVP